MPRRLISRCVTHSRAREAARGYSLAELAIVIGIISVVAGGVITMSSVQDEKNNRSETAQRLDAIEAALKRFAFLTDRLPCPASNLEVPGTANFGVDQTLAVPGCAAGAPAGTAALGAGNEALVAGAVPVRTLNLPENYAFDAWGNRFTYIVVGGVTGAKGLRTYNTQATNNVITMVDGAGNAINDPTPLDVVAFAIISHGKDSKGAISREGTARACTAVGRDSENCDGDIAFMDTRFSDSTSVGNLTYGTNYFDDLVRWKKISLLRSLDTSSPVPTATAISVPVEPNRISSSTQATFAIDGERRLYSWGANSDGMLGRSTNTALVAASPGLLMPGANDWVNVRTDNAIATAIRSNGQAYIWGANAYGQHSNGTIGGFSSFPLLVTGGHSWKQMHTELHVCGRTFENEIYCWGYGSDGQNGAAVGTNLSVPRRVGTAQDWSDITLGQAFSCGIRGGGRIFCWGDRSLGTFGDGSTSGSSSVPIAGGYIGGVPGTDWKDISSTNVHICGRTTNNRLYCWGEGSSGRLGNNSSSDQSVPVEVQDQVGTTFTDWDFIWVNAGASCGIRSGNAFCWGINSNGMLGVNSINSFEDAAMPVAGGFSDWVSISGDENVICGYRANRTAWCWGSNTNFRLGTGSAAPTESNVPVAVTGLTF